MNQFTHPSLRCTREFSIAECLNCQDAILMVADGTDDGTLDVMCLKPQ